MVEIHIKPKIKQFLICLLAILITITSIPFQPMLIAYAGGDTVVGGNGGGGTNTAHSSTSPYARQRGRYYSCPRFQRQQENCVGTRAASGVPEQFFGAVWKPRAQAPIGAVRGYHCPRTFQTSNTLSESL